MLHSDLKGIDNSQLVVSFKFKNYKYLWKYVVRFRTFETFPLVILSVLLERMINAPKGYIDYITKN